MADEPDDQLPADPHPGADGRRAFAPHDHCACVADAMAAAERICARAGARLTPVRRRVLELLWEAHRPVAAYGLLDRLREEGLGSQPPTIYRALDFLASHGLVHKVASLNAFIGCARPETQHAPQFLICWKCKDVAEMADPNVAAAVAKAIDATGFRPRAARLEVEGLCPNCAAEAPDGSAAPPSGRRR
ncbi:MAG: Fur family transcriptional regulator [Pseudomonadota bacterium]